MRRGATALTSAAALATGLFAAVAPNAAAAAGADVQGGTIALYRGAQGLATVNPDGTGLASVSGIGSGPAAPPNWAPDGSRLVAGDSGLTTGRATGQTAPLTLPAPTGTRSSGPYEDPAYWLDGSAVVAGVAGQLVVGPSDGTVPPAPLLTSAQEPSGTYDTHPTDGQNGVLAFERRSGATSDDSSIWTYDTTTGTAEQLIADGSSPVFSADGTRLAFVREVDGWRQLFMAAADGSDVQQLTTDAADHTDPTWDPAGGRIAYDEQTDPSSSDSATTVQVLDLSDGTISPLTSAGSDPAWQPLRNNLLVRVYGTGSIGIDQAASRWTFSPAGTQQDGLLQAKSAVLVNKTNATYSAPAVSLAAEKQGPAILTSAGSLDTTAADELKRVLPKGSTVYLPGSTTTLSDAVADQVTALGYKALRMSEPDLSTLSARVATQITATPSVIFVADGNDYHDPITASTAAGSLGYHGTAVVLLTNGKTIPASVKNYLNSVDPDTTTLVSVGTTADQALQATPLDEQWSYVPFDGTDPAQVAADLDRAWWAAPFEATVEDTWTWQNAAVGGAVTATYGPMLWSTEATLSAPDQQYLSEEAASVQEVQTFGGNSSYAPADRTQIGDAVAASSAWAPTVWAADGVVPTTTPALTPAIRSLQKEDGTAQAPTAQAPAEPGRPRRSTLVPSSHLPAVRRHTAG